MTRSDALIAAVTAAIRRRAPEIDGAAGLSTLMILIRCRERDGLPRSIVVQPQTEETVDLASLAADLALLPAYALNGST